MCLPRCALCMHCGAAPMLMLLVCSCMLLMLLQMALAHSQDHSMSLPTPVVVLADKDLTGRWTRRQRWRKLAVHILSTEHTERRPSNKISTHDVPLSVYHTSSARVTISLCRHLS